MYDRTLVLPIDVLPPYPAEVVRGFDHSPEDLLMMLFVTYVLNPQSEDDIFDAFSDIVFATEYGQRLPDYGEQVLDLCVMLYQQFKANVDPYLSYLHHPPVNTTVEVTFCYTRPGMVVAGVCVEPYITERL